MSRGVWVMRDGELIPKHLAPPLHPKHGVSAYVIGDTMDHTMNPVNGRHYDSKSAYYKAVRAAGCEIIGNENPANGVGQRPEMPDPGEDVKMAIEKLESGAPKRKRSKKRGL